MSKPMTCWMVKNADAIWYGIAAHTRRGAMHAITEQAYPAYTWRELYRRGYRIVKVEIQEVSNG